MLSLMAKQSSRQECRARVSRGKVTSTTATERPFVVEYYYKVKWGHADEFVTLFKKNHYPVLRRSIEMGRMLEVTMVAPRYHASEDARWDLRVTIVWKNGAIATDDFDEGQLKRELFPDQATFKQEEQRRFEILDAHWDLPITSLPLPDQPT